jgi:hypothetical protein
LAQINISDTFYDVKDILVNGQKFSFRFYPFDNGQISDIQVDGQEKNSSYKLDLIRNAWQEASSKASEKEKDKVDFKNFFFLTFQHTINKDTS